MERKIKIIGIVGSLRKGSYNRSALRAAASLAPKNAVIEVAEIGDLPLFNQDFEQNLPEEVKEFKEKIKAADAILFVTPEYNYSVPGVLKNAIDWASRPYTDDSWQGKPVAIMSASTGMLGGARAQYHLRQMLVFLNMHPVNRPEVMIPNARDKFDEKGNLIDEIAKEKIKELLEALVAWTKKLQK
jgi:chromate reductase